MYKSKLDEFYGVIIKHSLYQQPLMGPNSAFCLERKKKKKINYLIRSSVMSAKAGIFFSEIFA